MSNEPQARFPFPFEDPASRSPGYEPPPAFGSVPPVAVRRPRFQQKLGKHILLFLLTVVTTTAAGACHYGSFVSELRPIVWDWSFLWNGFWYSGTLLLILGAHEMGHYLYCRRYNVDATLPYFIPAPIPLTGTLGAVIRIREAFPTRKVLFDIGVAGPIAGFVVLVPAFFVGLSMSQVILAPPLSESLIELGEPLLFQWGADLMFGPMPEGHTINMHPMVFATWFGMLATALNLLPFGQLDGGHITYATLGRWSTSISILTVGAAVAMTFVSMSWIFMTVMLVLMLVVLGPRHPRVVNEYEPLGRGRLLIALAALAMLIVCFTPVPIQPYDLVRNP
ncbi:MAG TPA: site-2 protease family protein [Vicinamibacterales bacterium]|nr:site-2 protease family protein [Vicinamibacterales bacterium]